MRRLLLAALLATEACFTGASAPSAVNTLQVSSNVTSAGVFVGDTVQLNAMPLDLSGNVVPVPITYTSSNSSVAMIDNFGKITALAAGKSTIGVHSGGQTANLTLTVDGNVTGSVLVTPSGAVVAPGQSATLSASVSTTVGNPARNKSVAWSTADGTRVSVDQTGKVTGVAATSGVAVCATATDAASVKGCATVIVQPPATLVVTPVSPARRTSERVVGH
jgi:uncharacterized protein YjdB